MSSRKSSALVVNSKAPISFWRLWFRSFRDLALERDPRLHAEPLVVRVLEDLSDVHVTALEMQEIVRAGVGREPVFAVNLLPVGDKSWRQIFAVPGTSVRHIFATGLHDLVITAVH